MYSILFHLSGITILEICFFFYYIGPVETEMFKHHVKLLMEEPLIYLTNLPQISNNVPTIPNQPLSKNDNMNIHNNISNNISIDISNDIQQIFFGYDQNNSTTIINNKLQQNSDDSQLRRETENHNLFIQTIEYWFIFAIFSLCVFFIQYKYNEYRKLQKNRGLIIIDSTNIEQQLELINLQSSNDEYYRKGSIDESDDETNNMLNPISIENNKKIYYRNKIIHYVTFGSLVIFFQYMFFQYIVYYYNPLTINEIKYLMYQEFQNFKPLINNN